MIAALVVMTILGCDDSATQCHYISTVKGSWQTVALCDADSQKQLPKFSDKSYPVIVAMCEKTGDGTATVAANVPQAVAGAEPAPAPVVTEPVPKPEALPPVTVAPQPLPRRTLSFLAGALPDMAKLKAMVSAPVHSVEDGYSWVARRFAR